MPGSWAAASARTEGPLSRQLPSKSRHRRRRTGQVPGTLQVSCAMPSGVQLHVCLKKCNPCIPPSIAHVLIAGESSSSGQVSRQALPASDLPFFGCHLQKLSQWVGDYTQLGIQAARAKSLQQPRALHHPPVKSLHSQHSLAAVDHAGSRTLFRWLIRACLLYELLQWLQVRRLQPGLCDRTVVMSVG